MEDINFDSIVKLQFYGFESGISAADAHKTDFAITEPVILYGYQLYQAYSDMIRQIPVN